MCSIYPLFCLTTDVKAYVTLVELATDQHGLVSRAQALAGGVPAYTLDRYLARGLLVAFDRGLYRVEATPISRLTMYQQAVLWAGRCAVVSHASTLEMLELCDVLPWKTHVTVPRARQARGAGADRYQVHRIDLPPQDLFWHEGIPIMAVSRAIREAIRGGEDREQLALAIREGHRQGYLTRSDRARLTRRVHTFQ